MSSIDDAVLNDKGFWQEPEKGQPFGINYWIKPDPAVPEFSDGQRVVVALESKQEAGNGSNC